MAAAAARVAGFAHCEVVLPARVVKNLCGRRVDACGRCRGKAIWLTRRLNMIPDPIESSCPLDWLSGGPINGRMSVCEC